MVEEPDNEVIDGIKPEDVADISDEALARIAQEVAGTVGPPSQEDSDPSIELHDGEIMKASQLLMELQYKYSQRPPSHENFTSMRGEAIAKFAKLGLEVEVTWAAAMLSNGSGRPAPPVIEIIGRTTEFDIDRQHYDVNRGVADEFWDRKRGKKR